MFRLAPEHLAMLEKVTAIEQREKSSVMSYIISPRKSYSDSGEDEHENGSRVKAPPKPIPHWARQEQLVPFLQVIIAAQGIKKILALLYVVFWERNVLVGYMNCKLMTWS